MKIHNVNTIVTTQTRKPCCRKETARCHIYSYRFKVRQRHLLQV